MMGSRRLGRRLAATLAAASLGCGLAVFAAGTASAATPDYWGYALVLKPSGPVDLTHWRESRPSPVPTATPGAPGQEVVKFPKIGFFKQGVVHVTAVTDQLAWCQAQKWGPLGGTENVVVRCYRKGGVPTFVPFTVMVTSSSGNLPGGLRYAYVHEGPTAIVSSYNSTGMPNTVAHVGTGIWQVTLPGAGPATPSGDVQVTAVNPVSPAICDVGGKSQTAVRQVIFVVCFTAAGKPFNTPWNLSYQRGRAITGAKPKLFAYTLNNLPSAVGPYAPAPPAVNVNSLGRSNTIRKSGVGEWLVTFPRVGFLPNTIFVTGFFKVARVCNLSTTWATNTATHVVIVRDVVCYQVTGATVPTQSFITFTN